MKRFTLLALALCLTPLLSAARSPFSAVDVRLRWRGENYELRHLPEDLPESARLTLEAWGPWCKDEGYRFDLTDDARVVLITPEGNRARGRQMKSVMRVLDLFDGEFPAAPAAAEGGEPLADATEPEPEDPLPDDPLPEDPEGGDHPWGAPQQTRVTAELPTITSWGATDAPLDTETVAFLIPTDQKDYASALDALAESFPHLTGWKRPAAKQQGFVLSWPLAGAYIARPDGVEEWNPEHELVNRLARLLLHRRFGEAPNWFVQGYAWHAEITLLGGVYCFPYRDEFVFATEHASFATSLPNLAPDPGDPLDPAAFASWRRGVYEDSAAKRSWGMVEYLVRHRPGALSPLLAGFDSLWREGSRVDGGDGTWRRNTAFVLDVEDQARLLREHGGQDLFTEAGKFFRDPKRYRAR